MVVIPLEWQFSISPTHQGTLPGTLVSSPDNWFVGTLLRRLILHTGLRTTALESKHHRWRDILMSTTQSSVLEAMPGTQKVRENVW